MNVWGYTERYGSRRYACMRAHSDRHVSVAFVDYCARAGGLRHGTPPAGLPKTRGIFLATRGVAGTAGATPPQGAVLGRRRWREPAWASACVRNFGQLGEAA